MSAIRRMRAVLIALIAACACAPAAASAQPHADAGGEACAPGAHTLATPGARLYPETGNGGYTSLQSELNLVYDPAAGEFLPGNDVVLTDRATQCLSSFSLDFERSSANTKSGPRMRVEAVYVDGAQAAFAFEQPTYPGDPNGEADPDPRAHEASQTDPVGGPEHDPLPPACTPELPKETSEPDSADGTQCPANKLVITPQAPLPAGAAFTVLVDYSGRPGVHNDGDGSEEGWFEASGSSLVSSEPVGSEDWMPLNDFPTAKPTYTFHETVPAGETALANGVLASKSEDAGDKRFADGSATWSWESRAPVASYLVQSSIGDYELSEHVGAEGIPYYAAQDASIAPARKQQNLATMEMQEAITEYESRFAGPFPFSSDGSVVGVAAVDSGQEEMQTMIAFNHGEIELPVLWHENFHQWWGDNVTEGGYAMTFYKEGLAEWIERYVFPARRKSGAQFEAALAATFDSAYSHTGSFWTVAPSQPYAYTLFDNAPTYARPAAAYEALRRILGAERFDATLASIQRSYGGGNITEQQLEHAFEEALPIAGEGCRARLAQFFGEWFDTAYPSGGGAARPRITGPGLAGEEFFQASDGCPRPG